MPVLGQLRTLLEHNAIRKSGAGGRSRPARYHARVMRMRFSWVWPFSWARSSLSW